MVSFRTIFTAGLALFAVPSFAAPAASPAPGTDMSARTSSPVLDISAKIDLLTSKTKTCESDAQSKSIALLNADLTALLNAIAALNVDLQTDLNLNVTLTANVAAAVKVSLMALLKEQVNLFLAIVLKITVQISLALTAQIKLDLQALLKICLQLSVAIQLLISLCIKLLLKVSVNLSVNLDVFLQAAAQLTATLKALGIS